MNWNLLPYALLWGVLAAVVIALIVYRKMVASHEDDTLHVLDGEAKVVTEQVSVAQRLERIDRWGKVLTAIAILYGLAVGAAYIYQNWVEASNYMGR